MIEIIKAFGTFLDTHFDKLLLAGLFLYFGVIGDMSTAHELIGALLILIRSAVGQVISGSNNTIKDNTNGIPKQEDVK